MRRLVAILLLALLPLQFGWAAVSATCGHETGEQAQHLGHHEHQHQHQHQQPGADGPSDGDPEASAPGGFDFDCGHCHAPSAGSPAPDATLLAVTPRSPRARQVDAALQTRPASPPERPQWRRPA